MAYGFRLTVALAPNERFNVQDAERRLQLAPPLDRVVVRGTPRDTPLADVAELFFSAGGYPDEAEATAAGRLLKDAVSLAAASLLRGVDVGEERLRSTVGEGKKAEIERLNNVQLLDDMLGLQVYEEFAEPRVLQVRATPTVHANFDAFEERLQRFQGRMLGAKRSRAYALFARSRFESSPRAHHLALMAALEEMAAPRSRTGRARETLDRLLAIVDTELAADLTEDDDQALQTLRSALRNLRAESIASAIRRLVEESDLPAKVRGVPTREALEVSVRVRNKLSHGTADDDEVRALYGPLEDIVCHLIQAR